MKLESAQGKKGKKKPLKKEKKKNTKPPTLPHRIKWDTFYSLLKNTNFYLHHPHSI